MSIFQSTHMGIERMQKKNPITYLELRPTIPQGQYFFKQMMTYLTNLTLNI